MQPLKCLKKVVLEHNTTKHKMNFMGCNRNDSTYVRSLTTRTKRANDSLDALCF